MILCGSTPRENDLRDADVQTWLEGLQEGYEAVDGSGIQYIG